MECKQLFKEEFFLGMRSFIEIGAVLRDEGRKPISCEISSIMKHLHILSGKIIEVSLAS